MTQTIHNDILNNFAEEIFGRKRLFLSFVSFEKIQSGPDFDYWLQTKELIIFLIFGYWWILEAQDIFVISVTFDYFFYSKDVLFQSFS